ncbi:MAG: hypothetical protein N4A49_16255 [Marinifilaceae bacterium]|jgi:hypothetical protein|nr:hypothetical protein [Marinifilaceae bacterium]
MNSKFFTFIKPYLSFIDNGQIFHKPFSWLYKLIAILNLIMPLYFLILAIDNGIFDSPAKLLTVFILVWILITFAGWISFQLWWDRRLKVKKMEENEETGTYVFSNLIQTFGEWLGTWIGIVGTGAALLMTIILGDDAYTLAHQLGLGILKSGWISIVLMPVYGLLIILVTKFLSEQFRAITSIANNSKNIKSV